jgi:hypothetical protein
MLIVTQLLSFVRQPQTVAVIKIWDSDESDLAVFKLLVGLFLLRSLAMAKLFLKLAHSIYGRVIW